MAHPSHKKKTFLGAFLRTPKDVLEKKRLEAFLDSVPGAYCGWDRDGSIAWNDSFIAQLGLSEVRDVVDLQNIFEPEDSAQLESGFRSLRENGTAFECMLTMRGGQKFFKILGRRGSNLEEDDHYDVLWLEDISRDYMENARLAAAKNAAEMELKATQDACDTTPFPVWLRNDNLDLVWVNRAYASVLNSTPAQIIAQQQELLGTIRNQDKKEKIEMKQLASSAKDAGMPISKTGHIIVKGQRRFFLFQEIPQKRGRGFLGMAQDITREEELAKEMAHHVDASHALLDQLNSAVGIFNKDQNLQFYNGAFARLWKLDEKYLNTRPRLGDLMEKLREQRSLPEQADFRSFKKGWLDFFTKLLDMHEDMLYLPNEAAIRMQVMAHPLGGIMMSFEDVTSGLQLESSYNTLMAVQKETLDNLAEGVLVFGEDGRLKLWNPPFAAMWGLHPEDLDGGPHISKIVEKMKPFFDAGFWPEYYNQLISLGLEREENAGRLSRGDDHVIDYATLPLIDGGVLITFTDMTDTVQVEKALRERNTALETAERLKLDFLANVSYQLRTPLGSIMGFTEMLEAELYGPLNEQQKEHTKSITLASKNLATLIDDILDLSTIEAGYLELNKSDVDVYQLLSSLSKLVNEWARNRRIDIHLDCPKNIGSLKADAERLKQIILNLLRNAINFTPDDGSGIISMMAEVDGSRLLISVKDNGIGIPVEDQKRIFDPFERVQHSADNTRGAGLGLSIVKNITELHGGSIRLMSEPHVGTEIILIFPVE